MDCKANRLDENPKEDRDIRNYKHYDLMMHMALLKGDPVVLEWIRDAWREVKE